MLYCRIKGSVIQIILSVLGVVFMAQNCFASSSGFAGVELFEMAMNKYKNFAGEVGYRFDERYQVRFTIMDVQLTERHLSSELESGAVDGDDVEGSFRGYEFNLDRFFYNNFYVSLNVGSYNDRYQHQILTEQSIDNSTLTFGSGLGYFKQDLFGIKHAYLNFNVPIRYYFDSIDETELGDTTVREHIIVNNIWLFLGVRF